MRDVRRRRSGTRPELVWHVELVDELPVRRALVVEETGEILDEVWLDEAGRVRSWSKSSSQLPASRRAAPRAVRRESTGARWQSRTEEPFAPSALRPRPPRGLEAVAIARGLELLGLAA